MSYATLAAIVSLTYGFVGTLFLVFGNAATKNPYRILWGTLSFLVLLVALSLLTTGWHSVPFSLIGGATIFAIEADTLGAILFAIGRLLITIADSERVYPTQMWSPLTCAGNYLQQFQRRLEGRSALGWCVRLAFVIWTAKRN